VYKSGKYDRLVQRFADLMQELDFPDANLTIDEHRELYLRAELIDVQVTEKYTNGWICASGKIPPPVAYNGGTGNPQRASV
jgi:hypothetical protein